ncbi:MAG: hypothetical protein PQJ59_01765 [Spirochaetales bacterium]|nr:hypothetical protein [Spirochaetales bacterium]
MEGVTQEIIQNKISAILSAIDTVLAGGKSYSLNDGQGSQQVTRSSLSELQNSLNYWTQLYEDEYGEQPFAVSLGGGRRGMV